MIDREWRATAEDAHITAPALRELSRLVGLERELAGRYDASRHPASSAAADTARRRALQLDAVRTRLIEDGAAYLDQAWAFIESERKIRKGRRGGPATRWEVAS